MQPGGTEAFPDNTGSLRETGRGKPPVETRFQPGNPGRPKGARSKLTEAFLKGMCEDFEKHGVLAIEQVRTDKPDQYLKVIAAIIPKEITGEDGAPIAMITKIELVGVAPG